MEDFVNEESNSSVPENIEVQDVVQEVLIEQSPESVQEVSPNVPDRVQMEDCEEARESCSEEPQVRAEEDVEPSVIVEDVDDLVEPSVNATSENVQIEEIVEVDTEVHVRSEPVITEFDDAEVRIEESASIFTEIKTVTFCFFVFLVFHEKTNLKF